MACGYCQNFEISQVGDAKSQIVLPEQVIAMAKSQGAEGVAFTYSEPFVWYEYVSEVASLAKREGLLRVLKTNGYANEPYFHRLCELMDAVNIDVKGSAEFYKDVCGIDLPPDPRQWVIIRNLGIAKMVSHLEISTIVVEKYLDALPDVFGAMFESVGGHVPLHLLKFIPDFKMRDWSPTSDEAMQRAKEMAERHGFVYVYIDYAGIDAVTLCKCGEELIRRRGIRISHNGLIGDKCPKCGETSTIKNG
jgi:pyruvate formate lyase activating enzyme